MSTQKKIILTRMLRLMKLRLQDPLFLEELILKKKLRIATGTFDDVSDSNQKTFDCFSQ